MKLRHDIAVLLFAGLALPGFHAVAAPLPAEWSRVQTFSVQSPGLLKINLPVEVLNHARPGLEDLRLYDDDGNELAYLLERPRPGAKAVQAAKSFELTLTPEATLITLETGLATALDAVTLEAPAANFIKAVRVEASNDGRQWQPLGREGRAIFRQPGGADRLRIDLPPGQRRWLRLTVDDQRSKPIPFTGARLHAAAAEAAAIEALAVRIAERHENPGETRLTLDLGSANLDLASLQLDCTEPLFTRRMVLATPQVTEAAVQEVTIGGGVIYRVAVEGQPASSGLIVPVEKQIPSRELLVRIQNQDSPPLSITAVRAERRPVHLVFLARTAGAHHLLTGNPRCVAPRYDLAALPASLKTTTVVPVTFAPPADNPDYRTPEALAGVPLDGTALDVSAWRYRKAVGIVHSGVQQLELDLEVLAQAQPGFADLRLMRDGRQLPYLVERTSITRSLTPKMTFVSDPKHPKLSRWIIKLPQPNLPLARLTVRPRSTLFERTMSLTEEYTDDRGNTFRRLHRTALWAQTPEQRQREFSLALDTVLQSDTLILETDNGDNPLLELEDFKVFYPATRLLFKAEANDEIFLYYGNRGAVPPRYDVSLVAGRLLASKKSIAILTAQSPWRKASWAESRVPGTGGVLFWGILTVVVVALLVIIARLLPKSSPPAQ